MARRAALVGMTLKGMESTDGKGRESQPMARGQNKPVCQGSRVHPVTTDGPDRDVRGTVVSPVKNGECLVSWDHNFTSQPKRWRVDQIARMSDRDRQQERGKMGEQRAVEREAIKGKLGRAKTVRGGLPGLGKRK